MDRGQDAATEEKSHVASELCACRFGTRAKDAVAVSIRRQQDLLDEKCNRLTDDVTGSARKLGRLAYRCFIAGRDSKQVQDARRQRGRSNESHPRRHVKEIDGDPQSRSVIHHPLS
jgi:hypothetical protein